MPWLPTFYFACRQRALPLALLILSTSIFLTACGGGGSSAASSNLNVSTELLTCPAASQTTGAKVVISGQVTYERVPADADGGLDYSNIQDLPVRSVKIAALDNNGVQLAEGVTDTQGNYALSVNDKTCITIRVFAQSVPASGASGSWDFKVTDNTSNNALYAMDGDLVSSGSSNSVRNLHAPSGWNGIAYGDRVAAPFAIIDTVYTGVSKVLDAKPGLVFPAAELRWSVNNRPVENGDLTTGEIGTSFFTGDSVNIYLLGAENSDTDEYDEHLILHEWGHYFDFVFGRSDSMGGAHTLDDRLDLRVAFGEGWANAWSAIATDNPAYTDSLGTQQRFGFTFNMENNAVTNRGWFNEASVQSIIYDIYDETNEVGDGINLSLAPILNALTDNSYINFDGFTSLYAFLEVLRNNVPGADSAISILTSNQFISGSGFYGEGENNGSGAVPVYYQVEPGGSSILVCSDKDHGEFNKLQNRRLLRLPISSAGKYSFSVAKASADSASTDPDLLVWLKGGIVGALESPVNNAENGSVTLQPGNYLLELYDYYNIDEDPDGGTPTGGKSCFYVQVL